MNPNQNITLGDPQESPQSSLPNMNTSTGQPTSFQTPNVNGDTALQALRAATAARTYSQGASADPTAPSQAQNLTMAQQYALAHGGLNSGSFQNPQQAQQAGITYNPQGNSQAQPSNPLQSASSAAGSTAEYGLKNLAIGAAKGVGRMALGLSNFGQAVASRLTGISEAPGTADFNKQALNTLHDSNVVQGAGDLGVQIASMFLPGADGGEAANVLANIGSKLPDGAPSMMRLAANLFSKTATNAAIGAGYGYVSSGGDTNAAVGGAEAFGVLGAGGEALKATGLPLKLYSQIFDNSAKDIAKVWKGQVAAQVEKTSPGAFKAAVDAGAVKVENGVVTGVDESVAARMLKQNVTGSVPTMGRLITSRLGANEDAVQEAVKGFSGTVTIKNPDLMVSMLNDVSKSMKNVEDNKYSNLADALAQKIGASTRDPATGKIISNTGTLPAPEALQARRFFDAMRTETSFDKPANEVRSLGQKNFRFQSNKLRTALTDAIPSLKPIMKDYSYNIQALDDLSRHFSASERRQLFTWYDTMIFDTGLGTGGVGFGSALALARRGLQAPSVLTHVAQAMEQGVQSPVGKVAAAGLTSLGDNSLQETPQP